MALSLAFLLVSTDLGRGLLVPRLVGLANRELAGRIELKGFHLLTEGGVELVGLRVIDPEGEVVLALDRARIYADLKRIRSRSVGLRLALEGPDVLLQPDLEGRLSLVRALSPRHPSPPSRPHPFAWTVRVSELSFTGGHVHYRAQHPAEELEATALDLKGRGAYGPRGGRVELTLRGRLMKPQEAPLALDLAGSLLGSRVRVRLLRAAVGDTAVDLLGDGDLAARRGRVALLALAVDARQVQALVPGSPLGGDLAGTVYAESDGKRATLALDLAPRGQGGRARGAAALRLSPGALAAGAELHLEALDLSRVLRGAPASALTLDALGRAAGEDLSSLVGTLTLSLARSRLRGVELGPAELRASAQRGEFEVARLEAHLPGGSVEGAGRFRLKGELAGDAHVEASDVGALRRALERLLGEPLPPLEGALRLEAHLTGSEASPSAALTLVAPRLEGAGVAARGLSLRARLSGPLRSLKAALDGEAAEVTHGGFAARALRLRGELAERSGEIHVTANIPALGPEVLEVGGRGALSPDRQQLSLSELELTFSGAHFELEAPCTVSLAGPRVDRLALRSGSQAIALSGGIAGEGRRRTLAARATLTALDLALVPRAFLPAGLGLAGRLSADLTAEGALGAPSVSGRVELSEGAVLGIEGLSAHGDLGWLGPAERARFDLEVTRKGGGELAVKGELPGRLARAPRGAPLSLVLAARHLAVAEALRLARVTPPAALEGDASLELALGGTAGEPTVDLKAALEDGRYGEFEALAASLHLLYQAGKARLTAALDRAGARAVDLALSAPLDLAALLRDPERVARGLSGEPMSGVVDVKDQDLAAFSGRLGLPEGLQGRVTARLGLSGSPRAPRGELDASLED
ncbi:MAG TPA: translocation/assembly module TamB, partial [Anaeromyxobacteraceae bacterium]|nr:translocation/assembly module TamB [Anaeromyxobacteraceae bacterium]